MSCDITPISRHNLNTESLQTLAEDLSARLQINIDYGYYDLFGLSKYYNNISSNDFILLGRVEYKPGAPEFLLKEDDFLEKALYKKYGSGFFKSKEYLNALHIKVHHDAEIEKLMEGFSILYVDLYDKEDSISLTIYNECLNCDFYYYNRWWSFCRAVMEWQYVDKDALNKYRRQMMEVVKKTGGNKIYYVNDQSHTLQGVGQSGEGEMTWIELEKFITAKAGKYLVNIAEYNLNADYRNSLEGYDVNDLIFVDDFRDLETATHGI